MFPDSIAEYLAATDRASVRTPNTSEAVHCYTDDGRQWIRKGRNATQRGTIAECVSWLLAHELGVPVPGGAVLDHPDCGRIWMSERVPDVRTWGPGRTLANPRQAVRMLLLDVLIDNGDRHQRNILLRPEKGAKHTLFAIDHDGAMVHSFLASRPVQPRVPMRPSDPFWLTELSERWMNEEMPAAVRALMGLLASPTNRLEVLSVQALRAAGGQAPDEADVSALAEYLKWRASCAETMAWQYWEEAKTT